MAFRHTRSHIFHHDRGSTRLIRVNMLTIKYSATAASSSIKSIMCNLVYPLELYGLLKAIKGTFGTFVLLLLLFYYCFFSLLL